MILVLWGFTELYDSFRGEGVHKLKGEVEQFSNLRGEGDGAWKKRAAVFSPILEDRVHTMTLPNLRAPNQKMSDNDCMTAEILQKR